MKFRTLLILILIISSSIITLSQELNQLRVIGKAELQPNEIISKDKTDINGEVCGGIIIYTDLDGISFNSYNGIVDARYEPGKIFLFLSPGERLITVMKVGFKPLDIILNDRGINLKSGQVWKLEITGDKEKIPVTIRIKPDDAVLSIDGVSVQSSNSYLLSVGKHNIRIEHKNYKMILDTIEISQTNIFFEYFLTLLKPVPAAVNTIPKGASIYINNVLRGKSDLSFFEFPGTVNLKIIKDGFDEINETIAMNDIEDISANTFTYTLTKNSSVVNFQIFPDNSQLLIQKENYGSQREVDLAEGKYLVEIHCDGYKSYSEIIEVAKNLDIVKKYILQEITGVLQLTVSPNNAEVQLFSGNNLVDSWNGLKRVENLKIGEYILKVTANGFHEVEKIIKIRENEESIEKIELTELDNSEISIPSEIISESELIINPKVVRENNNLIITYNLVGEADEEYFVELFLVNKINKGFEKNITKISGDIGEGKFYGRDKKIYWDYLNEFPGIDYEEYILIIKCEEISGGIPWYYYLIGGAVGGAAAILLGGSSDNGTSGSGLADPPARPTQ